jgi:MarR family 2-MHQ and catechol resistance regulon transcriptional repressor
VKEARSPKTNSTSKQLSLRYRSIETKPATMSAKSTKTTKAEKAALDTYVKLMRAAETVTSRAHAVLPDGLTIAQFGVLEALHHKGPMIQSEIAAKVLKSAGNLTLVVDNLERDGHVRRTREPDDRRRIRVSLTPQGARYIAAIFPKVAASITAEFSALTFAEQAMLGEICKRLGLAKPAGTQPSAAANR